MNAQRLTANQVLTLLEQGMKAVDDEVDRDFEAGCVAPGVIHQLTALRGQYVFEKMRLVRMGIAQDDGSPQQAALTARLMEACGALGALQTVAQKADDWIDKASDGLAKVAAAAAWVSKA